MYAGSADQKSDPTKRDIFENFKSYNLEKPELIWMDNHLFDRHMTFKCDRVGSRLYELNGSNNNNNNNNNINNNSIDSSSSSSGSCNNNDNNNNSTSSSSSSGGSNNQALHLPHTAHSPHTAHTAHDIFSGMFDVIVTDPPYGIRAGAKKSGTVCGA